MRGIQFAALAALVACSSTPPSVEAPTNAAPPEGFTRQDVLRGSITPEREWWDLLHYDLTVQVFPETKSLRGSNTISFRTLAPGDRMQVDLQAPLEITRVMHGSQALTFEREENVYWIQFAEPLPADSEDRIQVFYEGIPVESENPP